MKLFGWKMAGRAAARPVAASRVPLARLAQVNAAGSWARGYEAQLRELYLNNAIAQRAVRMIAEGLSAAPLQASDPKALALVKATSAGQALLETAAMQLLLHGNAYIELIGGPDGAPAELYALRPERITIEADARGWPSGFAYRVGGATMRIPPERMIHIRLAHPTDDHYGLGCLAAASGAMAIHNAAARWNKALLDNAARPSGALVHNAAEALSAEQFDRLREELNAGFAGAENAGRPLLLDGGLQWQAMSLSPADMDFVGLKAAAAREIALAFGVPPMLMGLPGDATYANYREANRALWRQAILPLATKILGALAEGLSRWFAGLTLAVDLDQITALAEDRERLWAQLNAAGFLTIDEKRAMIGMGPVVVPEVPEPSNDNVADASETPPQPETAPDEVKFNPWHDPDNGHFTSEGNGVGSGSGSGAAMAKPPEKPKSPTSVARMRDGRMIVNKPTFSTAPDLNGKGYNPKPEDEALLARIIYAESLSNPEDFEAIGWSVVNRVGERQFGTTLEKVITQPKAFEVLEVGGGPKGNTQLWNETEGLNPLTDSKLPPDRRAGWRQAQIVANGILGGRIKDPTGGATFLSLLKTINVMERVQRIPNFLIGG